MPSLINSPAAYSISSSNEGSLVEITITNNNASGGAALANFIVTAIYVGADTEYVWTQAVATLAAQASVTFDMSIDGETYNVANLHVGIAFLNTP
ncbi:hypothetical protein [Propionispora hippei]|uniref:CARDB protein n=1 Tax=Propionispora hippei DSM 15287 TaxID=1123003 RepID=A0A1M6MVT1_9FIRM|nr:hypothetical protein [Propionispora hippei]SHJ87557.1 hypothetical protein SAMN02745170_03563 [Propionispora hippei DSM 15287]